MQCPLCHRKRTGQIGLHRFFCSYCFIEFELHAKDPVKVYDILDDGTLKLRPMDLTLSCKVQ